MSKKAPHRKPAADLLVKNKPVLLRLKSAELKENIAIAKQANCSRSELARRAYRAGLPLILAKLATSSPAGLSTPSASSPLADGAFFATTAAR